MTVRGPEMLLPSRVFLFFQNKVLFLLKVIFIHNEPLLLATLHQAATCRYQPRGWPLNGDICLQS